jgi:hypothetical protein
MSSLGDVLELCSVILFVISIAAAYYAYCCNLGNRQNIVYRDIIKEIPSKSPVWDEEAELLALTSTQEGQEFSEQLYP